MPEGVISDVDGTLVNGNDAGAQSWVDMFAEAGYGVPFDAVRQLIGIGADRLLPKTTGIACNAGEGEADRVLPEHLLAHRESPPIGRVGL